ncbi:hypothetical protein [Streptomyces sp. ALI-76-A]|uniref:hypothetical protein n=1 Tax=Streptomyces sp. ALI-76-A TaxID=3025736 RepID=UPI00256F51A3|nr:hypothetical protein [Streptomyces sp. ALI-76-A]MDL5205504.1 hypothetical protein [Streptomyces sp. ALI-76-A]
MDDHRDEGPGETGSPVPRDMPDQQAHDGEDPWELGAGGAQGDTVDTTTAARDGETPETGKPDESESAADVPDTDESGTGRQGASRPDIEQSEHPAPDEPSA